MSTKTARIKGKRTVVAAVATVLALAISGCGGGSSDKDAQGKSGASDSSQSEESKVWAPDSDSILVLAEDFEEEQTASIYDTDAKKYVMEGVYAGDVDGPESISPDWRWSVSLSDGDDSGRSLTVNALLAQEEGMDPVTNIDLEPIIGSRHFDVGSAYPSPNAKDQVDVLVSDGDVGATDCPAVDTWRIDIKNQKGVKVDSQAKPQEMKYDGVVEGCKYKKLAAPSPDGAKFSEPTSDGGDVPLYGFLDYSASDFGYEADPQKIGGGASDGGGDERSESASPDSGTLVRESDGVWYDSDGPERVYRIRPGGDEERVEMPLPSSAVDPDDMKLIPFVGFDS